MAAESAGAVVGALTWAIENADSIEPLGDWDPATGTWSVAATLPLGQPADLHVQFRNREGDVRKHYNDGTTAEIRVSGRVAGETTSTELDATIHAIEPGGARALADWSGSATSGTTRAPFTGLANPLWRFQGAAQPLWTLDGAMWIQFGETTLFLAFYGNVVIGDYLFEGCGRYLNEFGFGL